MVENAFKHGIDPNKKKAEILLELKVTEQALRFTSRNGKSRDTTLGAVEPSGSGIGISNLKRQLQLNYAKKHNLKVVDDAQSFEVTLELELD